MFIKIIYLVNAVAIGYLFNYLNIPAGWLIGALITGAIYGIFVKRLQFKQISFKVTLAFIGANISMLLSLSTLKKIHHLIFPLLITIMLTLIAGYLLGFLLFKKVQGIDRITAFFCCIPGGASEIIGISSQYGADDRMVAAFHTVRMTFFTMLIPFIISFLNPKVNLESLLLTNSTSFTWQTLIYFLFVIIVTLLLDNTFKIPGGTLIFSILIGFLLVEFVISVDQVPRFMAGIGQSLIGAFVGIRFNKQVLNKLLQAGPITIGILSVFLTLTLFNAFIFKTMTQIPFSTSLISTVPAGAAEMSVTAVALQENPTIVASLHIIRVMLLFLSLPFLLKVYDYFNKNQDKALPK